MTEQQITILEEAEKHRTEREQRGRYVRRGFVIMFTVIGFVFGESLVEFAVSSSVDAAVEPIQIELTSASKTLSSAREKFARKQGELLGLENDRHWVDEARKEQKVFWDREKEYQTRDIDESNVVEPMQKEQWKRSIYFAVISATANPPNDKNLRLLMMRLPAWKYLFFAYEIQSNQMWKTPDPKWKAWQKHKGIK